MRLLVLHLRSRRTTPALLALATIAGTRWATSPWTTDSSPSAWLLLLLPVAAASAVISMSTASPLGEPEMVTNPLPRLRFLHLATMVPAAAALLALTTNAAETIRNLAGFTGITLLTAAAIGPAASWVAPLAYTILCAGAVDLDHASAWTWPILPNTDLNALAIALTLLAAGTLTTVRLPKNPLTGS
ncbi:hypothetical protein GCM10029964_087030 [Kibdelosporangium lantanae]